MLWPRRIRQLWSLDPWREMRQLQHDMGRLFTDLWPGLSRRVFPPVNVLTGKDDAIVTAELPGLTPEQIDIAVLGDTLTLNATREAEPLAEGQTALRQERESGQFTRTIQLPYRVDPDKVEAVYARGILRITLPRLEADKPKQVTVSTSS